ncbi:class I SAM-dependent methyltransferase [Candidatus Protochlamydia sp. W-9]|uniref:class I SAM-dependent methyltransferase n=1 Tax=Candidatus Protochlamydia sp. W-9 TaxID=1785087 RepID=UPI0013014492|nr:class I SAM-dependent methyltransferase [Candidatus Protochlamydia sp. W-9]
MREQYDLVFINFLHSLYGEGHLSEGNAESNKLLISDLNLNNSNCLDFGCGTGGLAKFINEKFPKSFVTGVDIAESCISLAKISFPKDQYPNIDFVKYSPPHLPFPNQSFDFVFAKEVFIHIFNKEETLQEICRILKPGGQLIVIDWFANSRLNNNYDKDQIIQLSEIETFLSVLKKSCFINISTSELTNSYKFFLQESLNKAKQFPLFQQNSVVKDYTLSLLDILNNLKEKKVVVIRFQMTKMNLKDSVSLDLQ